MRSFGLADLEDLLRRRLQDPLPGRDAQMRFSPRPALTSWDPAMQPPNARHAAALLLLYPGDEGPTIVLTERRADLPHHPGQISLPGGALDPDEPPDIGALREAQEEIGIDPAGVRVVGALSTVWVLVSQFIVHPIVGLADTRPAFAPSPREVASLIEAPVAALRDPASLRTERRLRRPPGTTIEVEVDVPYFDVRGHQIWGATAMMLGEFGVLLDPSFGDQLQFTAR